MAKKTDSQSESSIWGLTFVVANALVVATVIFLFLRGYERTASDPDLIFGPSQGQRFENQLTLEDEQTILGQYTDLEEPGRISVFIAKSSQEELPDSDFDLLKALKEYKAFGKIPPQIPELTLKFLNANFDSRRSEYQEVNNQRWQDLDLPVWHVVEKDEKDYIVTIMKTEQNWPVVLLVKLGEGASSSLTKDFINAHPKISAWSSTTRP